MPWIGGGVYVPFALALLAVAPDDGLAAGFFAELFTLVGFFAPGFFALASFIAVFLVAALFFMARNVAQRM